MKGEFMNRAFSKVFFRVIFSACLLLALAFEAGSQQSTQVSSGFPQPAEESIQVDGENMRQGYSPAVKQEDAKPANIGFIISSNPYCYHTSPRTNICFINWRNILVESSQDDRMDFLSIKIDGQTVAYAKGFFETSIEIPFDMNGKGFRVNCGKLGDGGNPELGQKYEYSLVARTTQGFETTNDGVIYCPAAVGRTIWWPDESQ
jgi:hypothetical protein